MIPSDAPSEGIASPSLGPLIGRGRTAEIYAWGNGQVVKLFHTGWPEASIAYEERIAHLVKDLGLAAPRFFGRIQVGERIGLLYERIEGTSMLQALLRAPWRLGRYARRFAALHAAIHSQSQPGLPSQKASLARRIQDAPLLNNADKAHLLAYLATLPEGEAICHGDFHPDNILITSQGPMVIDWVDAKRGSPAADVARTMLLFCVPLSLQGLGAPKRWLIQRAKEAFLRAYLRAYRRLCPLSQKEVEAWLLPVAAGRLAERIPSEEAYLLGIIRARLAALRSPRDY